MKKPPAKKAAPVTKHATATAPHHATPAAKHPVAKPVVTKHPAAPHKPAVAKHPSVVHKKPVAKKHVAAKKHTAVKGHAAAKKATMGGKCTWLAFGIRKPWYRRGAQRLETVARLAGYVHGNLQAGSVIGIRFDEGYHAARMVSDTHADLWGEFVPVTDLDIEESWCLAD